MDEQVLRDSEELIVELRRIRLDLEGHATKGLSKAGSNMSQYAVMATLDEMGEMTMGALSTRLGTTMGAVTNLVDKLVSAGRVDRTRSEEDRRVVFVKLLPPGRELMNRVTKDVAEFLAPLFEGVPAENRRVAIQVVAGLVGALEARERSLKESGGSR